VLHRFYCLSRNATPFHGLGWPEKARLRRFSAVIAQFAIAAAGSKAG
jgi:hypothetical protein